jgi:peptide/nickel transport system substrate-binding protein
MRSVLIAATVVVAVAGCSSSGGKTANASNGNSTGANPSSSPSGTKVQGGTAVTYNFAAGPDYIFPLTPAQYFSSTNISNLQNLLWRPLYWYGVGTAPNINYPYSVAKPPKYSNNNKTVTITLNNYTWSDGKPVTSRDVEFWQNLITANKTNWGAYTPGDYPDNIVKTTIVNDKTIKFDLKSANDTNWFTYNELSQITPLPQHAWDKTSASGKVGNYDTTTAGAKAVYNFLNGQAKQKTSYASNPLWKVVDGPWKMTSYTASNGNVSFVPNSAYTGPVKPTLDSFQEKTFTTTDAEFKALLSGQGPDVGYISPVQLKAQPALDKQGYKQTNSYTFSIGYEFLNFNNPDVGPLFKQLYIRQVMMMLQNQEGIVKDYYSGTGFPGCGPIPIQPKNDFVDKYGASCPYKYDPAQAKQLLESHGWKVNPGGVSTCQSPGTGANQCGAGIPAGKELKITYAYTTGGIAYPKTIAQMKSDAAQVGFDYVLSGEDYNTITAKTVPCKPTEKACSWQTADGGWIYAPDYYPTGESLFQTGAGYNLGSYSDPKADKLIEASTLPGNSQQTLDAYQDYLVKNLPVIWGVGTYSLDEVKSNLHGPEPVNTFGNITPETWYFTK